MSSKTAIVRQIKMSNIFNNSLTWVAMCLWLASINTSNSSIHLNGELVAYQIEMRRMTVLMLLSPPESVAVFPFFDIFETASISTAWSPTIFDMLMTIAKFSFKENTKLKKLTSRASRLSFFVKLLRLDLRFAFKEEQCQITRAKWRWENLEREKLLSKNSFAHLTWRQLI